MVTNTNAARGLTWTLKDSSGTTCVNAQSITLNTSWTQTALTDPSSCTFNAGDIITMDLQPSAVTAATPPVVRIGELEFQYNKQ